MRKSKYTRDAVERFFTVLSKYEQALKTGTRAELITYSLAVHAAKGNVPPRMRSLVSKTFKNTIREIPWENRT